jgi:hypothetical protein
MPLIPFQRRWNDFRSEMGGFDRETMTFTGKVVLVAGGTGGLGRAVSLAFLREGAELIVTYRNDQEFADLKSVADANASRLVGRDVDVTDEAAVQQLIAGIGAEGKGLDVLVNTVGGYVGADSGRTPKRDRCDEVQLWAHALHMEEMFGTAIPVGALSYGIPRGPPAPGPAIQDPVNEGPEFKSRAPSLVNSIVRTRRLAPEAATGSPLNRSSRPAALVVIMLIRSDASNESVCSARTSFVYVTWPSASTSTQAS